jgi:hypothetical protein
VIETCETVERHGYVDILRRVTITRTTETFFLKIETNSNG